MGRISMRKISELLRMKFSLGLGNRAIAESLNISPSTISDYLGRAKALDMGWPLPEGITEQELYDKFFLPAEVMTRNRPTPNWSYICTELRRKGVTRQLLWREYREEHPNGLGYSQFCRYYNEYLKTAAPVMRQVHKGGEKIFVDYAGMQMEWIDSISGEVFVAEIFVGCLGASQYIYAEASNSQQLPDWVNSHINMFEYFGGVSEVLVPDNLKSGVTKAHRYDPDINANYQHFSEHYGVAIVPARSASPKDKAKVESGVAIVTRQILAPLRNVTFTSIGEINAEIRKMIKVVNNQQYQKMPVSRRELFEKLDKPVLKPLPESRYEYASWKKAKINIDYHFVFDNAYYSVPYQHVGKKVEIRATNNTVECFYNGQRIAAHIKCNKQYGYSTLQEHMPKAHQEHANFSPKRLQNWAETIGPKTSAFITHMLKSRKFPQQAYRACLGLLRLGKNYGEARLEKACAKGLLAGATRYQQIATILKNNLEEVVDDIQEGPPIVHQNIRGAKYYQQTTR